MSEVSTATRAPSVTLIRPAQGWIGINLGELWRFRELIYFLIWRDIKVRYKQTLFGAGWAILKPLLSMIIFTIVFGQIAQIPTDNVVGPVFYFSGLLVWVVFQDGITKAGMSLVAGSSLITKVYFPRLAVPLASVISGVVDFAIAFVVLLGLMLFYRVPIAPEVWALPLFLLLALVAALGVGMWLAGLNVAYRDVGYVIPFLVQAWMYASPIVYSTTRIPKGLWGTVYGLNPMAGAVQGFRWSILGVGAPEPGLLAASVISSLVLLVSGAIYFRRMERTFADVV